MRPLTPERRDLAARYYPLACRLAVPRARARTDRDAVLSDAGLVAVLAAADWQGRGVFANYLTLRVLAALQGRK